MSTSDDRPYDQESAHEEPAAGRSGGPDTDDTGVERHAPSSATELWDHNAYGREDGDIGGSATSSPADTRDPRGGAPAYNIDAGDDDAVRHGDDSGRDDGTDVRRTGESLTGADATAGDGRASVGDEGPEARRAGRPDAPSGTGDQAFDQEAADREGAVQEASARDATVPEAGARDATAEDTGRGPATPDTGGRGPAGRGAGRHAAGDEDPGPGDAGSLRGAQPGQSPSVVRHEERLQVGTERVETGRTRLRKYVVEEPVRAEQTLASEDVEEIRTPVTEEEREAFLGGAELPVGEDEVILYREVPVVRTVRVPYERVRLAVRRTERTEAVEETVRKERIDVEED
ncbi:YsnF/AvaK domain-containing protein [Kocuria sp. CH-021]|uniref:YsnF/AvaK domain-containing protein n=1 Tax=Kocuria sp. CH-021 TaxID=3406735 RepID=UPI003C758760